MSERLILVTGATGKVGRHVIERLLQDERCASSTVRGPHDPRQVWYPG
jgi:uncharacterized protein YbjT (DUF2867 family)